MGKLFAVKGPINNRGDGLDLSTQFLLNAVEVHAIFEGDQVDGQTQVTKAARAANAVQIGFRVLGEIKVDNNINAWNINATGEQIGRHQVANSAIAEFMENAVAVLLRNIQARVKGENACCKGHRSKNTRGESAINMRYRDTPEGGSCYG